MRLSPSKSIIRATHVRITSATSFTSSSCRLRSCLGVSARDYFGLKERCLYCDVLHQELTERKRLVAENADFVSLVPFASRSPFELSVFPKFHSSAFSRIKFRTN